VKNAFFVPQDDILGLRRPCNSLFT